MVDRLILSVMNSSKVNVFVYKQTMMTSNVNKTSNDLVKLEVR